MASKWLNMQAKKVNGLNSLSCPHLENNLCDDTCLIVPITVIIVISVATIEILAMIVRTIIVIMLQGPPARIPAYPLRHLYFQNPRHQTF